MESNLLRNKDVDIFIYSHIPFKPVVNDHVYKVLTNSKDTFYTDLEVFRDYNGNNIADKNIMYNEYSGLYWIWKNYPIKKYVGLNHYRRMYISDDMHLMQNDYMANIDDIFKQYDIILNAPINLVVPNGMDKGGTVMTNREWYSYWHNEDDLNLLGDIIKEKYPQYYDGFEIMCNNTYLHPSSMFIMKKDMFNEYCKYIFDVLFEFRKRRGFFTEEDCIKYVEEHRYEYIDSKGAGHGYYDVKMQSRIVGYIAERALGAYLMHGGENSIESKAKIFKWSMIPKESYTIDQK